MAFYEEWLARGFHGEMDYLARHAALKRTPEKLLPGCRSIVAFALNYHQPNSPEPGMPRIAQYALGRDYHKVFRKKLNQWLRRASVQTEAEWRICVDSAPIFERDYAHLAGLGWFGKNTCLIDSKRGSWFLIGLVLTTAELAPDTPSAGGCGSCRACIDACPTGAIVFVDGRWQVDARACISYRTIEYRGDDVGDTHGWTFGCDVCQEVCPFNHARASQPMRARVTEVSEFLERRRWPSLSELAVIPPDAWDALTAGSPVRRAGLEGLRRNARANGPVSS